MTPNGKHSYDSAEFSLKVCDIMYARIPYTSYKFDPVPFLPISEELYTAAKVNPSAFRRDVVNSHLVSGFKEVGLSTLFCWIFGAGLLGVAYLCELFFKASWANALVTGLVIAGVVGIASGVYTACSFLNYALEFRQFWTCVVMVASKSESYSAFRPLAAQCCEQSRQVPGWVLLIVLAAMVLGVCVAIPFV